MNDKTKGILTGIGIYFAMGIILVITSLVAVYVTEGSWDSLAIVFIMIGIMILVLLGLLIYAIVKYRQTKSQYSLGLIIGIASIAGYIILSELIMQLF